MSYPLILTLTRAPKLPLGLGAAVILLGGLLAPSPAGPALLGVVVLFLTWLLVLAWPRLESGGRVMRVVVIAALAMLAIGRAGGTF